MVSERYLLTAHVSSRGAGQRAAMRHGGRSLIEPLRGAVKHPVFFTFLAGHRSSRRTCFPGFRGISSLRSGIPRTRHSGTPGRYRFLLPEGEKNYGGGEGTEMESNTKPLEQVGEYAVSVDPMDNLECDSCQ